MDQYEKDVREIIKHLHTVKAIEAFDRIRLICTDRFANVPNFNVRGTLTGRISATEPARVNGPKSQSSFWPAIYTLAGASKQFVAHSRYDLPIGQFIQIEMKDATPEQVAFVEKDGIIVPDKGEWDNLDSYGPSA